MRCSLKSTKLQSKRILSLFLSLLIVGSLFLTVPTVSVSATDEETHIVTFHVNNAALNGNDNFTTKKTNSSGKIAYFPDTPQIDNYIFKGWYHTQNSDSQPVDFDNDTYSEDADVYARWISIGTTPKNSQDGEVSGSTVGGFDLIGVQQKTEMFDNNYGEIRPAGMRFVASLKNDVLSSLDALSDDTVTSSDGSTNRVEYGFLLTKKSNIDNWITYAGNHISNYEMQYNGTDVNGVNTTVANTKNYQGFITNVDCTAKDYSSRQINDHKKYSNYRLFTVVVNYSEGNDSAKSQDIASRAYIRYVDANGNTKVYYDDYDGTNTYGGCSISYNNIPNGEDEGYVYYSSLALCATDVNNLNNDNADVAEDDLEHAVCAMRVDGSKCYVNMMQNTTVNAKIPFQNECDIDLNGHTITETGAANLQLRNATKLYNGEIYYNNLTGNGMAASGSSLIINNIEFNGTSSKFGIVLGSANMLKTNIKNCSFNIEFPSGSKVCYPVGTSGATNIELNIEKCNFDIKATTSSKPSAVIYLPTKSNKKTTIKNCNFEVETKDTDNNSYVIDSVTDMDIINCNFKYEENSMLSSSNTELNIVLFASGCNCLLKNSKIVLNRNVNNECLIYGVYSKNASLLNIESSDIIINNKQTTKKSVGIIGNSGSLLNVSNSNITINNQQEAESVYGAVVIGTSQLYLHNNSKIKINDDTHNSLNYGAHFEGDAVGTFDYCNIDVPLTYNSSDDSWHSVGVITKGNAVTTFRENEGPVKVHGGNSGINSYDNSIINIYGGKFCSPTHGGGYFGTETNIYGGTFYNSFDAGEEPNELAEIFPTLVSSGNTYGGCYITRTANVTASNARFIGGKFGMRARANGSGTNNPQAVLTDCYVYGTEAPLSAWCGSITVAGSTVCVPELVADGTVLIDNRTP